MKLTFQHADGTISTVNTMCEKLASDEMLQRLVLDTVTHVGECLNCGGTKKVFVGQLADDMPCYMDCPECTHRED